MSPLDPLGFFIVLPLLLRCPFPFSSGRLVLRTLGLDFACPTLYDVELGDSVSWERACW